MGCNCRGGSQVVIHQNTRPDGTIKRYLTETEARRDADAHGGTYSTVTQQSR